LQPESGIISHDSRLSSGGRRRLAAMRSSQAGTTCDDADHFGSVAR